MDEDKPWSYEIENVDINKGSLFAIQVHVIGHALGLRHYDVTDSIMHSFYAGKNGLGDDDILAIQNLYGKPQNTSVTPQTPSSTTPIMTFATPTMASTITPEMDYPIDTSQIDLRNFENINMFLIANRRMYILHNKWLWVINPGETTYSKPTKITNWLTFLPKRFSKVEAVYQHPTSEIVMFIDSMVYMFDLSSLKLSYGYPKHIQAVFNINPNNIHTVINSYSGKTYILHDDNLYREVDECTFTGRKWGYISEALPGIAPHVDGSFIYIAMETCTFLRIKQ